ncbi:MAG: c-type cytochrome [Massilia sp.]
MRNFVFSLAAAAALFATTAQAADDLGKKSFETCVACHSVKAGENGVGPNLNKLIGRTAGSAEGFRYSGPMKRSGIVWDEKNLADFLRNPQQVVPGNRMPFSGMSDEAAVKALVQYLGSATR